ncbi:MAG: malectin domain-containing carbohydrate-binding protein, partial [bacterium]
LVLLKREGPLPGSAEWTHQYGDVGNTVFSKDKLVKPPLGLLWFGGPSHSDVLPRHGHGPPQQIVGGRLFIEGIGVFSARDVYTGRVLWRKEFPDLNTFEMYYNETYVPDPYDRTYNQRHIPGANIYGSNFVATLDRIYLVQGPVCVVLDSATGEILHEWTLPSKQDTETPNWGYIGVYEDLLIAGAAPFHISSDGEEAVVQLNSRYGVGSRYIVVMDRHSGEVLWDREAVYNFRHNTIVAGNGKLFCMDNLSQPRMDAMKRRGVELKTQPAILALDVRTGDELWRVSKNVFGTWLGYSGEYDVLLQAGSEAGDRGRDEVDEGMAAYRGCNGDVLWENKRKHSGPCILHHDEIILQTGGGTRSASSTGAFSLLTGEPIMSKHPLTLEPTPWQWIRFKGCNTAISSEHLLTFRSASGCYVDLSGSPGTVSIGGFRSGCTSNLVAADGVLNAPDYTRTCTCSYQNQTSLALVYMPEDDPENPCVEGWSFDHYPPPEQPTPVKRVGINFGAPGNRLDENGVLWLEFPSVGGPSPDIPIYVESGDPKLFRYHMSKLEKRLGGDSQDSPAWVGASGMEGEAEIVIRPFLQPAESGILESVNAFERHAGTNQLSEKPDRIEGSYETPQPYTIRLHFAELQDLKPGERTFDVLIQGKRVLEKFDIVRAADGVNRGIAMEFNDIRIKDDLRIQLEPSQQGMRYMPVICGVEVLAES